MWNYPPDPDTDLSPGLADLGFMYNADGEVIVPEIKAGCCEDYAVTRDSAKAVGEGDWLPVEVLAGRRLSADLLEVFHPQGLRLERLEQGRVTCIYRNALLSVPEYVFYKPDSAIWAAIRFQYGQYMRT